MNAGIDTNKSRDLKKLVQSMFNRGPSGSEQLSYSIGDVKSHVSVRVHQHSNLIGDIFAPRIIISGRVHGSVICRELTVASTGELWGDVSAVSIQIQPGGTIHGWLSTLDEGTIDLLTAGDISPSDIFIDEPELPPELLEEIDLSEDLSSEAAKLVLTILRNEASAAIQARSEIEIAFNNRLQELLESTGVQDEISADEEIGINEKVSDANISTFALPESTLENDKGVDAKELAHLRSLVGKIASVAHQYQLKYLWTKALLISELIDNRSRLEHHQEEIGASSAEDE